MMIHSKSKYLPLLFWMALFQVMSPLSLSAKVLLQAHFDGEIADADYALGSRKVRAALPATYGIAGIVGDGRWGKALDVSQAQRQCTYDAMQNFDPLRGTAELWFRISEHEADAYHPLLGWYRPPHQPGAKQRQSAFEVYLHGSAIVLGLYTPKYRGTSQRVAFEVGRWHHLEVHWDCEPGPGQSAYTVFFDGKAMIRVVDADPLKVGPEGRLHVGIWDYGFGQFLHGQIDELRITDQVEHVHDFAPPAAPYAKPATLQYAKETHRQTGLRLKQLEAEIQSLQEYSGSDGAGEAAQTIRAGRATVKTLGAQLAVLQQKLAEDQPNEAELCLAIDTLADKLSTARMPLQRIAARAAVLARVEDRRSLLFKDLNDSLTGQARILNGRQLFIDDHVIESFQGGRRVVPNTVVDVDQAPGFSDWGGGRLLYDPAAGEFSLWCLMQSPNRQKQVLCYARSADTRSWSAPKTRPLLEIGDRMSWYRASHGRAAWFDPAKLIEQGVLMSTDRWDRFVAVEAKGGEGVLTTRPFVAIGDTLVLNASASEGEIRVEAIDALGRVVEGFSRKDCKPIQGNDLQIVVSWAAGTNCHALQARPIQLRFYLRQARLFSFDFQIRHNHYVPNSYTQP